MENKEVNMILQAIRELSDKVDQNHGSIQQLTQKVDQNHASIQQLTQKVDQNHAELTKRMDRMEDKMDFIQHRVGEHDEEIYKLKRKFWNSY